MPVKPVKLCYSHIGGKLGSLLLEHFERKGWIEKTDNSKHFYITEEGLAEFEKMGIDISQIKDEVL